MSNEASDSGGKLHPNEVALCYVLAKVVRRWREQGIVPPLPLRKPREERSQQPEERNDD